MHFERLDYQIYSVIACTVIPKVVVYPLHVMTTRRDMCDGENFKEPMSFIEQAKEIYAKLGIRGFLEE
jgi:hypothetical protein